VWSDLYSFSGHDSYKPKECRGCDEIFTICKGEAREAHEEVNGKGEQVRRDRDVLSKV